MAVLVSFLFLCLDGYHVGLSPSYNGSGDFFGEPPNINWTHGWPFHFAVRSSIYPASARPGLPNPASWSGDSGSYSRWPFDNAPVTLFHLGPLLLDVTVLFVLLAGTWYWLRDIANVPFRFQFGTRALFLMTLLVALAMGLRLPSVLPRHVTQFAAFFVLLCGFAATVHTLVVAISRRVRRQPQQCTGNSSLQNRDT